MIGWLWWLAKFIATRIALAQLAQAAAKTGAAIFDTMANIVPYVDAWNELVSTFYNFVQSGNFPNVVWHQKLYYFHFYWDNQTNDYPLAWSIPDEPTVALKDGRLIEYVSSSEAFFNSDDLFSQLWPDNYPPYALLEEPAQAGNIVNNLYYWPGHKGNFRAIWLVGQRLQWDWLPGYAGAVQYYPAAGWDYHTGTGFEGFTPLKYDHHVIYRRGQFYYYDQSSDSYILIDEPLLENGSLRGETVLQAWDGSAWQDVTPTGSVRWNGSQLVRYDGSAWQNL